MTTCPYTEPTCDSPAWPCESCVRDALVASGDEAAVAAFDRIGGAAITERPRGTFRPGANAGGGGRNRPAWTMNVRWSKVNGDWVLVGPAEKLVTGETTTVHKRSGETSEVEVGERLPDNKYGDAVARPAPRKAPAARKAETDVDLRPLFAEGVEVASRGSLMVAVPDGDTRLKVRIRRASRGKWAGWIFVDDGAAYGQGRNYGKQSPEGLYEGKIADELKAILADLPAAFEAYGDLTGSCGRCGRLLEDEDSVERGLGPWCASKVGAW